MIYILRTTILSLMIMFLMITHPVMTMMINLLCLILSYTNLQFYRMKVIIPLDQNLSVKKNKFKPESSKVPSFRKYLEMVDLLDMDTVYDSTGPFAILSNSSLLFKQSQASNRNTRTKCKQRPLPRKIYCLFLSSRSSNKCLISRNLN